MSTLRVADGGRPRVAHKARLLLAFFHANVHWRRRDLPAFRVLLVSRRFLDSFFDDADRSAVSLRLKFYEYTSAYKAVGGKQVVLYFENHQPFVPLLRIAAIPSIKLLVCCRPMDPERLPIEAGICNALSDNPRLLSIHFRVGSWYDEAERTLQFWLQSLEKKIVSASLFDWAFWRPPAGRVLERLSLHMDPRKHKELELFSAFEFPVRKLRIALPAEKKSGEDSKTEISFVLTPSVDHVLPVTYHPALEELTLVSNVQIVAISRLAETLDRNFTSFLRRLPPTNIAIRLTLLNYARLVKHPMKMKDFASILAPVVDETKKFVDGAVDQQSNLKKIEFKPSHGLIYFQSTAAKNAEVVAHFSSVLPEWTWTYDAERRKFSGSTVHRGILFTFKRRLLLGFDDCDAMYW
ncbi:hypothetical protein M3Y99_00923700 [Aphelenchoides fujianensis]|nr:hypothetical protein M3Y99_00923700 [Aphelenchoides fujianensis]